MHCTISASLLKLVYKLLEHYQQDGDSLLNSLGLSRDDLIDVNKRIPYKTVYQLWLKASELIDDRCFGLKAAEVIHPSDLNALGYAWLSSSTLRTAFERLQRFQMMLSEFANISLSESGDQFEISLRFKDKNMVTMAQINSGLAVIMQMCRINYGHSLKPSLVFLTHEQPDCADKYSDYFGSSVSFSQSVNKLCFPVEIMDEVLINSSSSMALMADNTIIDYLESMQEENIISKVKQAIIKQLPLEVSIEFISSSLNMTPRTLHRHLKELNTSFKVILDDVRFDLSKQYITSQRYNLTEIAFQLGFSDSSSFSRAFKHWSGKSPTNYRKLA